MKLTVCLTIGLFSGAWAQKVSTDATCGGTNKNTCLGSTFGSCCSSFGWCGSTPAHCGTGCQPGYGNCAGNNPVSSSSVSSSPVSSSPVSSNPVTSPTRSSSAPASTATKVTTDATCGGTAGYTCLGSTFGSCCSSFGWCGSTTAHCGTGCQPGFGNCGSNNNGASSTVTSSTTVSSATSSPSASGSALQCLNGKNVPYKMSSDAAYAELAKPYNLRLPYKPTVIVLPQTNKHVQDAVVCGAQAGLKIQAKSGGHSYASFSSGGKDGSMGKESKASCL